MYRVYDNENKKWVKDICLSPYPHSDLYLLKKGIFGRYKLEPVLSEQYIIHKYIELNDKNDVINFEGDYCRLYADEGREAIGMVAYSNQLSSYVVLCYDTNEYFNLGSEFSEYIEVVGNVFEGLKEEE